jgi:hypothetical protein
LTLFSEVTTRKEQNFEKEKEEIKRHSEKGSQESRRWRHEEGQEGTG